MANVDTPFGCKIVGTKGGTYNSNLTRMVFLASDTTATFKGDVVKLAGTSDADGVPAIEQAAAGDTPVGIVVAFEHNPDNLSLNHREASTLRYAWVNTDPNVIFEIQEDGDTTPLTADSVGLNASIIVGAGSTVSGLSAMELDSSTALGTSTLVLHIEGFVQRADNEIGAQAKVLCSFNVHQYGSVGVAGV